jgi:RimJ/RimL family protein N-acetyltransferase
VRWRSAGICILTIRAAARAGQERVLALTDPDNAASQAVAGRLGLADEGLTGRWFGLTTRQYAWTAPPER